MSSSFSGLTHALASPNAQSYALSVTDDNIADVNNPGYTRQRANLTEVGPTVGVSTLYRTPAVNGVIAIATATVVVEAYSGLIGNLGTQVQGVTQRASVQQSATTNVDKLVRSRSGVGFDDETTDLLTYQRSDQASSRVLTTVDEMLDTLINRTGRVGLS